MDESKAEPTATVNATDGLKDTKIAELENENRRLNYRIKHLTRNLSEALQNK